ncbi:MAG TPA: glycosyltransferase family A protein [Chitinophagaceae bacterium]|jgi:glycosyltransferase involved in cell wall biosynthesis|nr:glycosyltransferase family A protein [Chitinophagaceae bacterium]
MHQSLVSIIVPCYNQAAYLSEALESVLKQTYANWECLIVNDGSTDTTEDVACKWVKRDSRFRYHHTENKGVSAARNLGLKKAQGTYILPLDGDDIIHEQYLQKAMDLFKQRPNLKLVYCRLEYFGKKNDWVLPPYNYKNLLVENMIFCSGVMKREEMLAIGGYDEKMVHGFEDWEFYINFLDDAAEVIRIDEVLFYYRLKESSRDADLSKSEQKLTTTLAYISTKHYEKYVRQYGSMLAVLRQNKKLASRSVLKDKIKNKLRFIKKQSR